MKSRGQISMLEHGRANPTAKQLVALQLLFGKTAAQLFPKLARDAEDRVMRTVTKLAHGQDARRDLRAQRKNTLFRQTSPARL
jgi:transcriptional regulator with XRE-family HTH domain